MKKQTTLLLLLACILPTFLHINISVSNNIHINKGNKA